MTITQAVKFLRNCARNGQDSAMYTASMVEQAIQSACNDFLFVQNVRLAQTYTDLTLTNGSAVLPALPTNFRPATLRRAELISLATGSLNPNMACVDFATVLYHNTVIAQPGQPNLIGFDTPTTGKVYPVPDAAYTLRLHWDQPFTQWTAGNPILAPVIAGTNNHLASVSILSGGSNLTAAPAVTFGNVGTGSGATATITLVAGVATACAVGAAGSGYATATTALCDGVDASNQTLNIADEYLMGVLRWAGVFFLQGNEPENQRAMAATWQNYLDYCKGLKSTGAGTNGKNIEFRTPRRLGVAFVKTWTDNLYQG